MDDMTTNLVSDNSSNSAPPPAVPQDLSKTQTQTPTQGSNQEELGDSIKLFQDKLIEELGFDKLEAVEKSDVEQKLAKLVNDRIINLILVYLPEEKAPQLNELLDKEDQDGILSLVSTSIPGIEEKLTNELMLLRKELLVKMG